MRNAMGLGPDIGRRAVERLARERCGRGRGHCHSMCRDVLCGPLRVRQRAIINSHASYAVHTVSNSVRESVRNTRLAHATHAHIDVHASQRLALRIQTPGPFKRNVVFFRPPDRRTACSAALAAGSGCERAWRERARAGRSNTPLVGRARPRIGCGRLFECRLNERERLPAPCSLACRRASCAARRRESPSACGRRRGEGQAAHRLCAAHAS